MDFPILIFIGIMLLIMGGIFLTIITIIKKHYDELYLKCTETTTGIVDSVFERLGSNDVNDTKSYYPIYKYIVDGQSYYRRSDKGSYRKKDVNTEDTIIYYNPNNPAESYTDKKTNDMVIRIFRILGTVFVVVGVILILLKIIVFR